MELAVVRSTIDVERCVSVLKDLDLMDVLVSEVCIFLLLYHLFSLHSSLSFSASLDNLYGM